LKIINRKKIKKLKEIIFWKGVEERERECVYFWEEEKPK
jgi:hypothetical protein